MGLALWSLFGTTNQLLASLTLLVATMYLYGRGRNYLVTLIPMVLMMVTTLVAMVRNLFGFWAGSQWLLFGVGTLLLLLAVGVVSEGFRSFAAIRRAPAREDLAVFADDIARSG